MLSNSMPYITADEMREVDRLMVEEFGIELIQMMENAGSALARLASEKFLNSQPKEKKIAVLAGKGGNGGGALSGARRLANLGAEVDVYLSADEKEYEGAPLKQLEILKKIDVCMCETCNSNDFDEYDLIIDGLIGYSLEGSPKNLPADLISRTNTSMASVISLDIPSGIHPTTGKVYEPSVIADATMTLALPKKAFQFEETNDFVGQLYLADIGVPNALYKSSSLNLEVNSIFATGDIIRLR